MRSVSFLGKSVWGRAGSATKVTEECIVTVVYENVELIKKNVNVI